MNESIMRALGLGAEIDQVHRGLCPTCGEKVEGFKDELSRREFGISGLCQQCQDETFTGGE